MRETMTRICESMIRLRIGGQASRAFARRGAALGVMINGALLQSIESCVNNARSIWSGSFGVDSFCSPTFRVRLNAKAARDMARC